MKKIIVSDIFFLICVQSYIIFSNFASERSIKYLKIRV